MCFPFSLLVPSSVPHPVSSSSYESPHKITFSWQPLLQSEINGQLLGYKVQYQMVAVGGELVTDSESLTEMVPPDENVFLLSNQSVYTSFRFKVAAVTTAGEGNFSEEVTGGITVSIVTLLTIFFFFFAMAPWKLQTVLRYLWASLRLRGRRSLFFDQLIFSFALHNIETALTLDSSET